MKQSTLLRKAAEYCENRIYAIDKSMVTARAISGVAQEHRQKLGIAAESMRQEAVRLDEGDTEILIGPMIFDGPTGMVAPFAIGNMAPPSDTDEN